MTMTISLPSWVADTCPDDLCRLRCDESIPRRALVYQHNEDRGRVLDIEHVLRRDQPRDSVPDGFLGWLQSVHLATTVTFERCRWCGKTFANHNRFLDHECVLYAGALGYAAEDLLTPAGDLLAAWLRGDA